MIELNNMYIVFKIIDGIKKEQIVKIDHISQGTNNKKKLYGYYYGTCGYHEGYTYAENIRELTDSELEYFKNNQYYNLPQQFYHSLPV